MSLQLIHYVLDMKILFKQYEKKQEIELDNKNLNKKEKNNEIEIEDTPNILFMNKRIWKVYIDFLKK